MSFANNREQISENGYRLKISSDAYPKILGLIAIALLLIHCGLNYYNYQIAETEWLIHQLFDLDEENNIPTWFSSFLLANNAFVLYLISQRLGVKYQKHWFSLAIGFLILSIDETAGLHESFHSVIDFNWAIAGGGLVFLVALAYLPFLLSLDRGLALWFVVSGAVFVSGAIGVELLAADMDEDAMPYGFATALEEGMEMLGSLLFLWVNLNEMKNSKGSNSACLDIAVAVE